MEELDTREGAGIKEEGVGATMVISNMVVDNKNSTTHDY